MGIVTLLMTGKRVKPLVEETTDSRLCFTIFQFVYLARWFWSYLFTIFSTANKLCYYQSPFRVWLSALTLLLLTASALWTSYHVNFDSFSRRGLNLNLNSTSNLTLNSLQKYNLHICCFISLPAKPVC